MLLNEYHEKLRPYIFWGVELNNDKEVAKGDCPTCGKPGHFFVKTATGQFQCKVCSDEGNTYTFLQRLRSQSTSESVTDTRKTLNLITLRKLAILRKLAMPTLVAAEVGVTRAGDYFTPAYNTKGALSNLYKIIPVGDNKFQIFGTPGCKVQMFGVHSSTDTEWWAMHKQWDTVWLAEGLWDYIALLSFLSTYKQVNGKLIKTTDPTQALIQKIGVFGVPGCSQFDPSWFELLEGKAVLLAYDNDHPRLDDDGKPIIRKGQHVRPGWDGMQRVVKLAGETKHRPKSVSIIHWNKADFLLNRAGHEPINLTAHPTPGHHPDLPDGFDARDMLATGGVHSYLWLLSMQEEQPLSPPKKSGEAPPAPPVEAIPRASFDELVTDYEKTLHFTKQMRDTLATMLAVVHSTFLPEEPLWLRVIGPPGSAKTTLAEAISAAREWVSPKSVITGFHSGFVDYNEDGERQADSSLINELNYKTVVMKDADTLINGVGRDRILSELRDIYDGSSRTHYRHKVKNDFENIQISFILCGTDELRALNRTFLGERFLDCEIFDNSDATPILERVASGTYNSILAALSNNHKSGEEEVHQPKLYYLKQVTYGFIKHLKTTHPKAPEMGTDEFNRIITMAKFVSFMRARVKRDGADIQYRSRTELGTRLTAQFTKLSISLALVLGRSTIDCEVARIVQKIASDTSCGFQYELTQLLARNKEGTAIREMVATLNLPESTLRRLLSDMQEFGIVQRYKQNNNSGQRGRDLHLWQLTPHLLAMYQTVFHNQEESDASSQQEEERDNNDRPRRGNHNRGDQGRQGKAGHPSPKRNLSPPKGNLRRNPKGKHGKRKAKRPGKR